MKKHLVSAAAAAGILITSFGGAASAHENTYKVVSGDSLWKISQTSKISITNLKTWNKLSSNTIYVNQKLTLMAPHSHQTTVASSSANANSSYTVKAGDTLWGISREAGMSVSSLKVLNGLKTDFLVVGQVLKLTATATSAVPVTNVSSATAPKTSQTPAPVSKASALIEEAKKYIGSPYAWGGNTPAGFDCSGYLKYVFNKVGVTIPRTVATIWNATAPVTSLQAGDIVFFETYTSGPSHAGIYLGSNKFIHAGSSTGVTISDMSLNYWKTRYLGAKSAL